MTPLRPIPLLAAALALAAAGCPAAPPLDQTGYYRCDSAADCPAGWFCRADESADAVARCWATPECTPDDASACDDGLSCTTDACDDNTWTCTHNLAPATCLVADGCLDCSQMALPPCGVAACNSSEGTCVVRPRTDGGLCSPASCTDVDAWQSGTACTGQDSLCAEPPAPTPCPADACELGRCADFPGGSGCYTRVAPTPTCALAGSWSTVWQTTRPCGGACNDPGAIRLSGGLGNLVVDDLGRGTYSAIAGNGVSSIGFTRLGVDSRIAFSSDLDVDWQGWLAASGDLIVASNPETAGLWWMVRTDPAAPARPQDLAGRWRVMVTTPSADQVWRVIGGEVTFDKDGCIVSSDDGTNLHADARHLPSPIGIAQGACTTTTPSGRLSTPLLETHRDTATFEGTLASDGAIGIFALRRDDGWDPDMAVLIRVAEEEAQPQVTGTYGFIQTNCFTTFLRIAGSEPKPQQHRRATFGGAVFDAEGNGAGREWDNSGPTARSYDYPNGRGFLQPDGLYRIDLLPPSGDGLSIQGGAVAPRATWPTAPVIVGYPMTAEGRPANGNISVFLWIEDDDALENPITRPLVPAPVD